MRAQVLTVSRCWDNEAELISRVTGQQLSADLLANLVVSVVQGEVNQGDLLNLGGHRARVLAAGRASIEFDVSPNKRGITVDLPYALAVTLDADRAAGTPGASITFWEQS